MCKCKCWHSLSSKLATKLKMKPLDNNERINKIIAIHHSSIFIPVCLVADKHPDKSQHTTTSDPLVVSHNGSNQSLWVRFDISRFFLNERDESDLVLRQQIISVKRSTPVLNVNHFEVQTRNGSSFSFGGYLQKSG